MDRTSEPFANVIQLISFQDHIKKYFLNKGYKEVFFDGEGFVILNGSQDKRYGIWNVAQNCAQASDTAWDEIINNHFEVVFKIPTESEDYLFKKASFEKVKNDVKLQLYPYNYLDKLDFKNEVINRSDIPGTLSIVVMDLPSALQTVSKSDVELWGMTEEEIFKIALANTLKATDQKHGILDIGEIKLNYLEGENLLTAVHIFNIESFENFIGTHGSLVSIPTRHFLLSYPIEDLGVVKAVQVLGSVTSNANADGPGSLSPLLYWYKDGKFTVLPYSIHEDKFDFTPPFEFISLLNTLN